MDRHASNQDLMGTIMRWDLKVTTVPTPKGEETTRTIQPRLHSTVENPEGEDDARWAEDLL